MLPNILSKEQLLRGNSILQTTNQTVFIAGPIIGALLIETVSYQFIFPIVALCLIITSIVINAIKYEKNAVAMKSQSPYQDFLEGVQYVKKTTLIFTLMCKYDIEFFYCGSREYGNSAHC
ncbi:hypothetical protein [Cytobacillus purgationiresistens]|uniref:MFS family permease n=1 Tax=Cytobacillus purgationiresistens TaxID=863449 RepID=A0ABU0AMN5_9BACI|nr:hypothetical protein [Cytobacillus purgationiresistens]MDQ0272507.1 MFS family permease [Cytobacillus purgationiresistens]